MNLLPRQHKNDLRLEAWRRYLLFLGFYLTTVLVSAATLLLPSLFYLQFQIDELEKTRDVARRTPDYETMTTGMEIVEGANRSLRAFEAYLKNKPAVTPILEDVVASMPSEVNISNFTYTRGIGGALGALKLSGEALHRDHLRTFIAKLQVNPQVSGKVSVPDAAFRIEENTPFVLDIALKP